MIRGRVGALLLGLALGSGLLWWWPAAEVEPLTLIVLNVESDPDTDPAVVAADLARLPRADLWGLSEVEDAQALDRFRLAVGERYQAVLGGTGGSDRLGLLYDPARLKVLEVRDLAAGGKRDPLVARVIDRRDGRELLVVVVHLDWFDGAVRRAQARVLREWAQRQSLPVIMAGDFNFDWRPSRGRGDAGFDVLTEGGTLRWVEPDCVGQGTCPATGTACEEGQDLIRDFVFVGGPARNWPAESSILLPEPGHCARDALGGTDHRPVLARLWPAAP